MHITWKSIKIAVRGFLPLRFFFFLHILFSHWGAVLYMKVVKICKQLSVKEIPQKYSFFVANVEVLLSNSGLS